MDGVLQQMALPIFGVLAVAGLTFYAVSFAELREKSFKDLEEADEAGEGFKSSLSSRGRRAQRKAGKQNKN